MNEDRITGPGERSSTGQRTPHRAGELFDRALEFTSAEERQAFLRQACGGDVALQNRVERLLAAHEKAGSFLDAPAAGEVPTVVTSLTIEEGPGAVIGRYKLLQQIGEGGCGVVYMAEQHEPVRRRVALKVIKLGMDTRQVIARFEAERQALALMDHPNIAKVLDAGTTDAGRPFFVMELVRGVKITDFCDESKLTTRERLELFINVCQAVQHAHQKGIIHRDLKPSNVLVTVNDGVPVPKVIDFGIAKATSGQQLTDKTLFTAFEQFVGTPAYMSPEQAVMTSLDIDTRSDIYSLGVLLYELLTGKTPFDSKDLLAAGLDEMRRTLREREPVRPSTRLSTMREGELSTTAKHRQADPARLFALLRGDLDWIVMKCLEKDRTHRYETSNGLAMDIQRHLNNEPIVARPPSRWYRFERMVRRNKLAVSAASAIALSLLLGLAASTFLWFKERIAYRHAVRAELTAQAEKLAARRQAYGSDMNLAQQALAASNLGRTLELLNAYRPRAGEEDLRGWEWRYLWQQCRSAAISSFDATNWIGGLSVSPDGHWLATAEIGPDRVNLWDLASRRFITRAGDGGRSVLAFSPKSSLLAFGGPLSSRTNLDGLCLWDPVARRTVFELPVEDGECWGVAFSDDEKLLATIEWDGIVRVWEVSQLRNPSSPRAKATFQLPVHGRGFAASRDLGLIARVGSSGGLCVFDTRTTNILWQTAEHFSGLAFSPDTRVLACGGSAENRGQISLRESTTGKVLASLDGHRSWVRGLVFATNGTWLASAGGDQTIRLWDIRDLAHVPPPRLWRGHRQEIWGLTLLPDGKTLASASKDGEICFWDTGPERRERFEGTIAATNLGNWCFTSDGRSVRAADLESQEFVEWTLPDGTDRRTPLAWGTDPHSACWSGDGRLLAVGSSNGLVQVFEVPLGKPLARFAVANTPTQVIRFDRQNRQLAVAVWRERDLEVWELAPVRKNLSWRVPERTKILPSNFRSHGLDPELRWVLAADEIPNQPTQDRLSLRNLENDAIVDLGVGPRVWGQIISPDGRLLIANTYSPLFRVYDVQTRRLLQELRGFLNMADTGDFSPDGQRLVMGSASEGLLKTWDTHTWRELVSLPAELALREQVQFSADGSAIGTWTKSGTFRFFRAPSFAEIEAAESHVR